MHHIIAFHPGISDKTLTDSRRRGFGQHSGQLAAARNRGLLPAIFAVPKRSCGVVFEKNWLASRQSYNGWISTLHRRGKGIPSKSI